MAARFGTCLPKRWRRTGRPGTAHLPAPLETPEMAPHEQHIPGKRNAQSRLGEDASHRLRFKRSLPGWLVELSGPVPETDQAYGPGHSCRPDPQDVSIHVRPLPRGKTRPFRAAVLVQSTETAALAAGHDEKSHAAGRLQQDIPTDAILLQRARLVSRHFFASSHGGDITSGSSRIQPRTVRRHRSLKPPKSARCSRTASSTAPKRSSLKWEAALQTGREACCRDQRRPLVCLFSSA